MSTASAIANLGAELVVFVAAASLFVVAVGRPEFLDALLGTRVLLEVACLLMAVTAVTQGILVDTDPRTAVLVVARASALVLLAVGAAMLPRRLSRTALLAGAGMLAASELAYVSSHPAAGHVVRAVAGLTVGVAALEAARRSIATRIAAVSTTLLLVVALALSGALSAVITGNISREAVRRADERARIQANQVSQQADVAIGQADFIGKNIMAPAATFRAAVASNDYTAFNRGIEGLLSIYHQVDFVAFVDAAGAPRASAGIPGPDLVSLAGSKVVRDAVGGTPASSVEVVGAGLGAVGASPISLPDARGVQRVVGAAVAGVRIDSRFLQGRLQLEKGTFLTVVTRERVVASTLSPAPTSLAEAVGRALQRQVTTQVLADGRAVAAHTAVRGNDTFLSVHPVMASDGTALAALVVGVDGRLVASTRASLFRTLFLVALGAAGVAFAVAVYAGARLARPVRRLTVAARRVSEGDFSARAGVDADDEIGVLGSSFDAMTESIEHMTREIREAAAQTEAILRGMAEGLVATDAEGTVVAVNPAAASMLGSRPDRLVGRPVAAVVRVSDRDGRSLEHRFGSEGPWSQSGFLERRRGSVPVAVSGAPIRSEQGETIGSVYVLRDMQREFEVERMKTEFLSNISHELRTPLTPIKGYAEMMLARDVPKERARSFLSTILQGAERLERYVDMLVHVSELEAGRFDLRPESLEVGEVVGRVAARWRSRSPRHRVDLEMSSRLPRVTADERLLERALNELVDNAVKYSPDGGTVTLAAHARGTGSDRRVEISVSDEGIGIAPGDLDVIFAEFAQLDGSATRRYGGLGLGLSFVDRVVREHHGHLEAWSEPGEGSTFTIVLPLAEPHARSRRRTRGNGSAGHQARAGRR